MPLVLTGNCDDSVSFVLATSSILLEDSSHGCNKN